LGNLGSIFSFHVSSTRLWTYKDGKKKKRLGIAALGSNRCNRREQSGGDVTGLGRRKQQAALVSKSARGAS